MAYGREMLRKAGSMMLDADEAYADALNFPGYNASMQMGHAIPLRDMGDVVQVGDSAMHKAIGAVAHGGLATANVAARYGLPLGGLTLAGKGLMDLTGMFAGSTEQTSGTIMPS